MTMLAVRRKPPGEEPEGSCLSATSLVVHPFLTSDENESDPPIAEEERLRLAEVIGNGYNGTIFSLAFIRQPSFH